MPALPLTPSQPGFQYPMDSNETWTTTHDLALIYIALAYGTDHDLSDDELDTITSSLREWATVPEGTPVSEVVMEAAAAFLEGDARAELRRSIGHLRDNLGPAERRQALEDVIRIAEADGVLLEREQGLIGTLAEAWSLKKLSRELIEDTSATVQRQEEDWSLIHELAFVYVIVAHSADDELNPDEIEVILDRLQEWQDDLSEDDVREVVRRALQVYADDPGEDLIRQSVEALKEALPDIQRLAVLDDLHCIARADGPLNDEEQTLIRSLSRAWDVNVRFNGRC
jgi:uncharacterized tellurite resistance protein B-like protein